MSSKRRLRRKQCGDKTRHSTAADALTHIRNLKDRRRINGTVNAYRCRWCGGYHIGHAPGSARTRITRV